MLSHRLLTIGLTTLALGAGATTASAETISISDGTVETEATAADHVKVRFIVTRTRKQGEVDKGSFSLRLAPGSAQADADYVAVEDDVALGGGTPCASAEGCEDSEAFDVELVGDDVPEPQENFFVKLTALGMTVTDSQGEGTILDDDGFVPPAPVAAPQPVLAPTPATAVAAPQQHVAAPATSSATAVAAPAAEQDVVGPAVDMVFRGLRGSTAKVRVKCPSDEKRCVGRLAVQLNEKTMASAPYRLRGGETKLLRIHL